MITRMRKMHIRYIDNNVDNILNILDWLRKKGVRSWAFRDLFESTPTIYYKYKKDLSSIVVSKFAEFYSPRNLDYASVDRHIMCADINTSIMYADNRSYFISSQTQNIHPL